MNILRRCFKEPLLFLLDTSWEMVLLCVKISHKSVFEKKKGLTVKPKAKQVCKPQT